MGADPMHTGADLGGPAVSCSAFTTPFVVDEIVDHTFSQPQSAKGHRVFAAWVTHLLRERMVGG